MAIKRPAKSFLPCSNLPFSRITIPQRPLLFSFRYQQPCRLASYRPFPGRGRGGPRYTRIYPTSFYTILQKNQIPITVLAGTIAIVYFTNLETVPVTNRRRWNVISAELEKSIAGGGYEDTLKQFRGNLLPESHPYSQMVSRVLQRLIPHSGDLAKDEWKIHVVDDPKIVNAFVMPGNKVFFFTGMLPMCQNETGVAAVLGHEIGKFCCLQGTHF